MKALKTTGLVLLGTIAGFVALDYLYLKLMELGLSMGLTD